MRRPKDRVRPGGFGLPDSGHTTVVSSGTLQVKLFKSPPKVPLHFRLPHLDSLENCYNDPAR